MHVDPTVGRRRAPRLPSNPTFLLGVAASAGANFSFHAVAARRLAPAAYAQLAALLALAVAVAVPAGAVQAAVSASVARNWSAGRLFALSRLGRRAALGGAATVAGAALCAPALASLLRIGSLGAVLAVGPWLALTGLEAVGKGALLGVGRSGTVGVALAAGGVIRVAAVALLAGRGLGAAMWATVAGEAVIAGLLWQQARHLGEAFDDPDPALTASGDQRIQVAVHLPEAALALGAQLALWLLAGAGVILARQVLPGSDAGTFAAASTLASAAVFLPQAVAASSFPSFVAGSSAGAALARSLTVAIGLAAVAALGITLAGRPVLALLLGGGRAPSISLLAALSAAGAALGCTTVVSNFLVAQGRRSALLPAVGVVTAAVLVNRVQPSTEAVAWALCVVCGATLAACTAAAATSPALRHPRSPVRCGPAIPRAGRPLPVAGEPVTVGV